MIVLDTNVLSELVKPAPEPRVVQWLDVQDVDRVTTTVVTAAEIWYGVRRLPAGRRRTELATAVDEMFAEDLRGRIIVFDLAAADHFADIVSARERRGLPISISDAQIAAICADRSAVLATRNVRDFAHTGIEVVDPWSD